MTASRFPAMASDFKMPLKIEPYLTRRPVVLALLFLVAVVSFLAVSALSRIFQAQQAELATRWFSRGVADLNARRFENAALEFRTALRYSRDDYSYQLDLAEALMGQGKADGAYSYLINLWDRQPENGFVNLELARVAAQKGQTDSALRYYHNAVYAVWSGDEESARRYTRLELIGYLLKINAKTQAQSELIALGASLGEDAAQQAQLGDLFLSAQDYEHALTAFHLSLRSDPHNHAALAGAGLAAFRLARYPLAEKYLQEAVAADPQDAQSAAQLKSTEDVLFMDPFRRETPASQRARVVVEDFRVAGERLKSCPVPGSLAQQAGVEQNLADDWAKLKPRIDEPAIRRDPDLAENAMELVFNIERQTSALCGTPSGPDLALLMIARLHAGS